MPALAGGPERGVHVREALNVGSHVRVLPGSSQSSLVSPPELKRVEMTREKTAIFAN